jgi:hypothetical protein
MTASAKGFPRCATIPQRLLKKALVAEAMPDPPKTKSAHFAQED